MEERELFEQKEPKKSYIQMSDGLVIELDTTTSPVTEIIRFYSPIPLEKEYPPKPHPIPPELKEKWEKYDDLNFYNILTYDNFCYDPNIFGQDNFKEIEKDALEKIQKVTEKEKEYLSKIREYLSNHNDILPTHGLVVFLNVHNDELDLEFSLDHLKDSVNWLSLMKEGKLDNEIKLLYYLAHLPYAESWTMHLYDNHQQKFYIVDRIILKFKNFFSEKNYKKDKHKLFSYINPFPSENEIELILAKLRRSHVFP